MATNDLGISDVNVVSPSPLLVIIASTPVLTTAKPVDSLSTLAETTQDIVYAVNLLAGTSALLVTQYTVPANKYAVVRNLYMAINTTPAASQLAYLVVYLERAGVRTTLDLVYSQTSAQNVSMIQPVVPLLAGDKIVTSGGNSSLIAVAMVLNVQVDQCAIV
jgi:hypothetical protein